MSAAKDVVHASPQRIRMVVAGAAVAGVGSVAYATFGPGGSGGVGQVAVAAAVTITVALVLIAARPTNARTSAIMGGIALLLSVSGMHWTGVPIVLGAAAVTAGLEGRSGGRRRLATAAIVLGALAALVSVGIVFLEPLTD